MFEYELDVIEGMSWQDITLRLNNRSEYGWEFVGAIGAEVLVYRRPTSASNQTVYENEPDWKAA